MIANLKKQFIETFGGSDENLPAFLHHPAELTLLASTSTTTAAQFSPRLSR